MYTKRLPAEWEPQSFVQIAWPHADTDWNPYLQSAVECYRNVAREVSLREDLIIVTPEPESVREILNDTPGVMMDRIHILEVPTNDTWARDHAFLTLVGESGMEGIEDKEDKGDKGDKEDKGDKGDKGGKILSDFCFNGWGQKFASNFDNRINEHTFEWLSQNLKGEVSYADNRRIVLEGGSVESDGCGTLLTTTSCLMAPNRNYYETKAEAEEMLRRTLNAKHILWLDNSWLDGDDTDGHIDTVARLCPNDTIVYVQCTDPEDEHFGTLSAMERELMALRTIDGRPFRLIPVPLPDPVIEGNFAYFVEEEREQRLPATYANFLIVNGAVLMPTYGQPAKDRQAMEALQDAFPDREIVGIDCQVLVRQHGSLHCITMQYPA
ncbi:MAG: agmatine deiminase family protein [Bacteroidales bacterium]|nr:agmatine deiminase family protein [Candidatus Liminaster caballi]